MLICGDLMLMEDLSAIIIACLTSTSLVSLITYFVTRRDQKKEKVENVAERLDSLEKADTQIREDIEKIRKDVDFSHKVNHLNVKDRVSCLTQSAMKQGYISVHDLSYIEEGVALLKEDGENGNMTACLEAARSLPVK